LEEAQDALRFRREVRQIRKAARHAARVSTEHRHRRRERTPAAEELFTKHRTESNRANPVRAAANETPSREKREALFDGLRVLW
jgi:hypothetical protein